MFVGENLRINTNKCLHNREGCGIMTAKQELYLRIPVSALAAESRALGSAGGTVAAERTWHDTCAGWFLLYDRLRRGQHVVN